jgi:DNA-binding Xre family transcriptional regulator
MRTNVLTITLGKRLLAELKAGRSKVELAANIGVSTQKLTRMTKDEWEYITKDAIERAADYFELEVSDIFNLEPVDFWKPIEQTRSCTFVRGSLGVRTTGRELTIPWSDDIATAEIKTFLRESLNDVSDPLIADDCEDEDELMKRVARENCIVIGSPKTNAATEILLSRFFGAEPFKPSDANRRKIPFGFCWTDLDPRADRSSLTCSTSARKEYGNRPGIALQGIHVPAHFYPTEQYATWDTNVGKDCGIVFVTNNPFGTNRNVKLIVLAGFSGIGTLGAAKALVEDFRYLEPVGSQRCVYGVVEATFSKRAQSSRRKLRDVRWRYRNGGHWPLNHDKG